MSTVINLGDAYGKPLHCMNPEKVRMTFDGPTDEGAHHRAIAIARDLCRMGVWDGQSPIRIADPYKIYNALDCWVTVSFEAEYGELVARWTEPLVRREAEQQPQSAQEASAEDEAWNAYNAAHRLNNYPPSHPGFQRVLRVIEQREPLEPAYLTDQNAFEDMMHESFGEQITAMAQAVEPANESQPGHSSEEDTGFQELTKEQAHALCIHHDPECPNPGWPIPCPKCNFCFQNPDELTMELAIEAANEEVDAEYEKRLAENPDWLAPATEEELSAQSSNSCDLFDDEDYGEDDDWEDWPEQAFSAWVRVRVDGHVSLFNGILSRYRGEDWGEASGWEEHEIELDTLKPENKQKILAYVKGKGPGDYEPPFDLEVEDDDDDQDDDQDFDYTDKIYHGLDD